MSQSEYLTDSQRLIRMSSAHICENMSYEQIVHSMTFFSFGIERLLKHILFNVNPVFVLKNGDFKNAAPCLYKERFISTEKNEQISVKPNHDVITFRTAMQRALLFSSAVQKNKQLLYALAQYRDTLAHRPTSEIDITKACRLIARDGVCLVEDICSELSVTPSDFFGEDLKRLDNLSKKIVTQENLTQTMESLFSEHMKIWDNRKINESFVSHADVITESKLSSSGHDYSYENFTCPACTNEAIARIVADYEFDKVDQTAFVTGVFVDEIHCYYCDLHLDDYEELDFVDINSIFEQYADQQYDV